MKHSPARPGKKPEAEVGVKPLRPALVPLKPFTPCDGTAEEASSSSSMSRRSSSSDSTSSRRSSNTSQISGKCVHFHFNPQKFSSYHVAYSREEYDRSPIIPSGEDLDIPSCKTSEEGGWIKCLQRKAREAAKEGQPPPFMENLLTKPCSSPPLTAEPDEMLVSPLEGLISPSSVSSVPSFSLDDSSSSASSEDFPTPSLDQLRRPAHRRAESLEMLIANGSQDCEKEISLHFTHDGNVSDDGEEGDAEELEEGERRLGMCGLGKWSRSSLYQENDCFGGF